MGPNMCLCLDTAVFRPARRKRLSKLAYHLTVRVALVIYTRLSAVNTSQALPVLFFAIPRSQTTAAMPGNEERGPTAPVQVVSAARAPVLFRSFFRRSAAAALTRGVATRQRLRFTLGLFLGD